MQLTGASGLRNVGLCALCGVAAADARSVRRPRDKIPDRKVSLEFGFLLLVAASALLGFVLRRLVSPIVTRTLMLAGVLGVALGILGLTASGRSPFDALTGGLIAAVLLGLAGLVLPFALVVRWSRS
jgi:hypothetical protein